MAQLKSYLVYLLYLVYCNCAVLYSTQSDENTTKTIARPKQINVNDTLVLFRDVTAMAARAPIHPQHNRIKREIDANQGSSWLKYVWRERKYKIPQMWLTNIRNLWAVDQAGGKHLFDPGVPYGTVYLLKTLVLDSLFPRIGKNQ